MKIWEPLDEAHTGIAGPHLKIPGRKSNTTFLAEEEACSTQEILPYAFYRCKSHYSALRDIYWNEHTIQIDSKFLANQFSKRAFGFLIKFKIVWMSRLGWIKYPHTECAMQNSLRKQEKGQSFLGNGGHEFWTENAVSFHIVLPVLLDGTTLEYRKCSGNSWGMFNNSDIALWYYVVTLEKDEDDDFSEDHVITRACFGRACLV